MNNELEHVPTPEENAPPPEAPRQPAAQRPQLLHELFDYLEIFSVALISILLIFTFALRLCRVDGSSMNETLWNGEQLITTSLKEPRQGDIVVFHLINDSYTMPLVKRMIADEGQKVRIDLTAKEVYVDGILLNEPYVCLDGGAYNRYGYFNDNYVFTSSDGHTVYEITVPEGHIFVMGDNRNHSSDSRSRGVGCIDKDCIMGKALFRLAPFTVFD